MKTNLGSKDLEDLAKFGYKKNQHEHKISLTYANQDKNTNRVEIDISIVKMNTKTMFKHNNK
jgi:hypothetical protein